MRNDLPTKMGVIAFVFVLLSIIIFCALSIVSDSGGSKVSATAKQVVIRERIEESERGDIWRTSIYSLDKVSYDTIPKKTSWDTAHELVYGPVTSSEIILKQNPLTEISRYTTTTIYVGKTVTETIQFETVDLNNYFNPEEADWNATEISEEEERLLNEKGVVLCDTLVFGKKFVGWYRVTKDKKTEKNDLVDKPKSSNNKQNIYKI